MAENTGIIKEETASDVLAALYGKALDGIPRVSKPIEQLASDYLDAETDKRDAAWSLAKRQIAKCGTSGLVSGLGGFVTLPVAVPANISSVLYVQLRMVAAIAVIGGHDVHSDQVETMTYLCLTGAAINDVVKEVGGNIGIKLFEGAIRKVPASTLRKINQKVGFRLLTKFGETGAINLGKMFPLVSGVAGGAYDAVTTTFIANNAISMFLPKKTECMSEAVPA